MGKHDQEGRSRERGPSLRWGSQRSWKAGVLPRVAKGHRLDLWVSSYSDFWVHGPLAEQGSPEEPRRMWIGLLLEMGHLVLPGWRQGNVRKDCPRPWPQGGSWGLTGQGRQRPSLRNSSGRRASMHEGSLQTWQQHVGLLPRSLWGQISWIPPTVPSEAAAAVI